MDFDKLDYINICLIQLKYNGVQSIITNGPKYKPKAKRILKNLKNDEIHSYIKANNIIEG